MPALLAAAVSALMTFILKIVEWLVAKYALYVTARLATSLAWVTFYIALLVALAATFSAILSAIEVALPGDLAQGMAMVKPANFEACVAAIYGSKIAMWIFQQKKQLIDWERMTGGQFGGYGR
ncbi:DUF5455 family protein [Litchfieldella rifensis]|uniref:DUF5455 family protein n=1 Tax=Litchfieldella rifensis TaxID=762643 RepID=A0ABV7LK44_9GAMM